MAGYHFNLSSLSPEYQKYFSRDDIRDSLYLTRESRRLDRRVKQMENDLWKQQAEQFGIDYQLDPEGNYRQRVDERGRPLFKETKWELFDDEKKGRIERRRDRYGQMLTRPAEVSPGESLNDPHLYYKDGSIAGTADELVNSQYSSHAAAASEWRKKRFDAREKSVRDILNQRVALAEEKALEIQNELDTGIAPKMDQVDRRIEELKARPEYRDTVGQWWKPKSFEQETPEAQKLSRQIKALEKQRGQLQERSFELASQLEDGGDISGGIDRAKAEKKLWETKSKTGKYESLEQQRLSILEGKNASKKEIEEDQILNQIRRKREAMGLEVMDLEQRIGGVTENEPRQEAEAKTGIPDPETVSLADVDDGGLEATRIAQMQSEGAGPVEIGRFLHHTISEQQKVVDDKTSTDKLRAGSQARIDWAQGKLSDLTEQMDAAQLARFTAQTRDATAGEKLKHFGFRTAEAFGTQFVDLIEFADRTGSRIVGAKNAKDNIRTEFYDAMREVAHDWGRKGLPKEVVEKLDDSLLLTGLPSGLGSMAGFMVPGALAAKGAQALNLSLKAARAVGLLTSSAVGGAASGNALYREVRDSNKVIREGLQGALEAGEISQKDYNETLDKLNTQEWQAEAIGVALGLTEGVPVAGGINRIAGIAGGNRLIKAVSKKLLGEGDVAGAQKVAKIALNKGGNVLVEAVEESTQELFQSYGENLAASGAFGNIAWDPERQMVTEESVEGGIIGGSSGALLSVITQALPGKNRNIHKIARNMGQKRLNSILDDLRTDQDSADLERNKEAAEITGVGNDIDSLNELAPQEGATEEDATTWLNRVAGAEVKYQTAKQALDEIDSSTPNPVIDPQTGEGVPDEQWNEVEKAASRAFLKALYGKHDIITEKEANALEQVQAAGDPFFATEGSGVIITDAGRDFMIGMAPSAGRLIPLNETQQRAALSEQSGTDDLAGVDRGEQPAGSNNAENINGENEPTPPASSVSPSENTRVKFTDYNDREHEAEVPPRSTLSDGTPVDPNQGNTVRQWLAENTGQSVRDIIEVTPPQQQPAEEAEQPQETPVKPSEPEQAPQDQPEAPEDLSPKSAVEKALSQSVDEFIPKDENVSDETKEKSRRTHKRLVVQALKKGVEVSDTAVNSHPEVAKAVSISRALDDQEAAREAIEPVVDLFGMIEQETGKEGIDNLKVEVVDSKEMSEDRPAQVVFDKDGNATIRINRNRTRRSVEKLVSNVAHEGGHVLGYSLDKVQEGESESFLETQWKALTPEQRKAAVEQYGDASMAEMSDEDLVDQQKGWRARQEWFAFQWHRMLTNQQTAGQMLKEGHSKEFVSRLNRMVNSFRKFVNRWIGDGNLSTEELDSRIRDIMGSYQAAEFVGPTQKAVAPAKAEQKQTKQPVKIASVSDGLRKFMKGRGGSVAKMNADVKREWLNEFGRPSDDTGRKIRYEYELSDGRVVSAESALKETNPKAYEQLKERYASLSAAKAKLDIFKAFDSETQQQIIESIPLDEIAAMGGDISENITSVLKREGHLLADVWQRDGAPTQKILSGIDVLQRAEKHKAVIRSAAISDYRSRNSNAPSALPAPVVMTDGTWYYALPSENSTLKQYGWEVSQPTKEPKKDITFGDLKAKVMQGKPKKGKRPIIGERKDGGRDVLDTMRDNGLWISPPHKTLSGGEYDGYAEVFGKGPARVFAKKTGNMVDELVEILNGTGEHNFESVDEFYDAAAKAVEQREQFREKARELESEEKTDDAMFGNEGRNVTQKATKPVKAGELTVGDWFKVRGEKFEVQEVDPDSGKVTLKDGVVRDVDEDMVIYADRDRIVAADYEGDADDPFGLSPQEYVQRVVSEEKAFKASLLKEHDIEMPEGYRKLKDLAIPDARKKKTPQAQADKEEARQLASTQVTLPESKTKPFVDYANSIPGVDLYTEEEGYGIEDEPHVTVLFGLVSNDDKPVREVLKGEGPITIKLGKTSLFENDDFDVLKVSVSSPDLRRINKKLSKLENESKFPDYTPHLTIAYLKKGGGRKYAGDNRFEGQGITFDSLTFSGFKDRDGNRKRVEIKLKSPDLELQGQTEDEIQTDQEKLDQQEAKRKEKEAIADKQAAPLTGDSSDVGQGALFDQDADLFSGDSQQTQQREAGSTSTEPREDKPQQPPPDKESESKRENKEPAKPIEDFGEKIGGARKDYAESMSEAEKLDTAKHALSKTWPEPDYQSLLESGIDPFIVGFIRASRDEIPPKPRQSYKVKRWVKEVEMLRGMSRDLLSGQISPEAMMEALQEDRFANVRDKIGGRAELYQEFGHDQSFKGTRFEKTHWTLYKGEKNVTKWQITRRGTKGPFGNMPRILAEGDTRQEAINKFRARLPKLQEEKKGKGKTKFDVYSYRSPKKPGIFIGKKIGKDRIDLFRFENAKEANEYLRDNYDDVLERLESFKRIGQERRNQNAPRIGVDHRKGKDITPDRFDKQFGFRGVEFGNYVEQSRRQSDLNQAYDSLMDLAGILNIPPRAISLDGKLALAFGARGKGGKDAPAAHYEPGKVVINLTKRSGPGSLAHEWWHAVDNYFGKQIRSDYVTESNAARLAGRGSGYVNPEGIRDEMTRAFGGVINAISQTQLPQRSNELDKRKTKPYWSQMLEMSARSFENYVIERLAAQKSQNDYLANIADTSEYADSMLNAFFEEGKTAMDMYPYLTQDEVTPVVEAFDVFFNTVKTKNTNTGVALFAPADRNRTGFRIINPKGKQGPPLRYYMTLTLGDRRVPLYNTTEPWPEMGYKEPEATLAEDTLLKSGYRFEMPPVPEEAALFAPADPVDSPAFKKWFGSSKIVDEDGKPLVVYHGGSSGYNSFKIPAFFTKDSNGAQWFADERGDGTIYPAYIKSENPLDLIAGNARKTTLDWLHAMKRDGVAIELSGDTNPNGIGKWEFNTDLISQHSPYDGSNELDLIYVPEVREWLNKNGYDSIIAEDMLENGFIQTLIVWNPTQIKSATGNSGAFNPEDPNILNAPSDPQIGRDVFPLTDGRILFAPGYHGSPHTFDKFSTEKIGTGEGAQAYGWGLGQILERLSDDSWRNFRSTRNVPTPSDKSLSNAVGASVKILSEAFVSDATDVKQFSQLDVERRRMVMPVMRGLIENRQIFESIVRLIPIDVMNMFGGRKFTTEMLLNNQSVFINLLSIDPNDFVASDIQAVDVLAPSVAVSTAKMFPAFSGLNISASELSSAVRTSDGLTHLYSKIPQPKEVNVIFDDADIEITHKDGEPVVLNAPEDASPALRTALDGILKTLPEIPRMAFTYYTGGSTFAEIAKRQKVSTEKASQRVMNTMKVLKKRTGSTDDEIMRAMGKKKSLGRVSINQDDAEKFLKDFSKAHGITYEELAEDPFLYNQAWEAFQALQDETLYAPEDDAAEIERLMAILEEGIVPMDKGTLKQAQNEPEGDQTMGRPDLANPGTDSETRKVVNVVDELRKFDEQRQTFDQWRKQAEEMVEQDSEGVKRRLLEAAQDPAYNGTGTAVDIIASKILVQKLTRRAITTGDQSLLREAEILAWAYREEGANAARAFTARRDTFKRPAERHAEFLLSELYKPSKKATAAMEDAPTPAEKSRRIDRIQSRLKEARASDEVNAGKVKRLERELRQAQAQLDKFEILHRDTSATLKKVEKELLANGVTLEDLFGKEIQVRLKGAQIVKNIAQGKAKKASQVILMLNQGKLMPEIRQETGLKVKEINQIIKDFREDFKKRMMDRVKNRGFRREDLDAKSLYAPGQEGVISDEDAEHEIEKMLADLGFGHRAGQPKPSLSDPSVAVQIGRVTQIAKPDRVPASDYLYEFWINSILSGPQTQMVNITGNALNAGWRLTVQRAGEAMINEMLMGLKDPNAARLGEFKYMMRGIVPGLFEGVRNASVAWGAETSLFRNRYLNEPVAVNDFGKIEGWQGPLIPGKLGKTIRLPGRALIFMDELFKGFIIRIEVGAHAYRIAKAEGLKGEALKRRIQGMVNDIGGIAWHKAANDAIASTFQQDFDKGTVAGSLAAWIAQGRDGGMNGRRFGLRWVIPFVRTLFNIIRTGVRMSPMGSLTLATGTAKGIWGLKNGKPFYKGYGNPRFIQHFTEQLLAWTAMAMLWGAVEGDEDDEEKPILMTGSRPWDSSKRGASQMYSRTGLGAYTLRFKVGDKFHHFQFGRYEPFATTMGITTDLVRAVKHKDRMEGGENLGTILGTIAEQVDSKNFAKGLSDVMELLRDPGSGARVASQYMSSFVPNIFRQPIRVMDPKVRETSKESKFSDIPSRFAESTVEGILPWTRSEKIDLWGNPMLKEGNKASRLLVPQRAGASPELNRLDQLLLNYAQAHPGKTNELPQRPSRRYEINGESHYMNDDEFRMFMEKSGKMAFSALSRKPLNVDNPTEEDVEKIKKALSKAQSIVRNSIKKKKQRELSTQ